MEKWYVAAKRADFNAWAAKFHISPVTARILRNRDVTDESEVQSFLYGTLADCHSPWLLKDMEKAVEEILTAIEAGMSVRVIGDYDVDGICSAYILTKTLQILGAKADTAIPHRIYDGYGLNDNLIEEARRDGIGMIVTCDNGIAAASQIAHANSYGIKVIVTDHHEVPFVMEQEGEKLFRRELLPPALAVIDPKQEQCHYPFPNICGGVVAYKLALALEERTGNAALRDAEEELLEFAALSTVCDVMELKGENRILVKEGLTRLNATRNPGIRALTEVNGIEPGKLSAHHLGFVIGPCLNATGRLDTAKRALELLLAEDACTAAAYAGDLYDLNASRKEMTERGVERARELVENTDLAEDKVLVIFLPDCHESLAGIIAGRIREQYHRPVFVLTESEEGVKGSGRSIEAYSMYEEMSKCSELFTKFGGHPMAAGLSLPRENVDLFRQRLNENTLLTEADLQGKIVIDVPMPLDYITKSLVEELKILEPFGKSNEKPVFADKDLHILSMRILGKNRNVCRMQVQSRGGRRMDAIYFGKTEEFLAYFEGKYGEQPVRQTLEGRDGGMMASFIYYPEINSYQGRENLQFVVKNYC